MQYPIVVEEASKPSIVFAILGNITKKNKKPTTGEL
jgi:hypothetical protein